MDLAGRAVTHKTLGQGRVVEQKGRHITVAFGDEEKQFAFPGAFASYLSLDDPELAGAIDALMEAEAALQEQKALAKAEKEKLIVPQRPTPPPGRPRLPKVPNARPNIAFKCNFCDGGESDEQVGFQGVCSDRVMAHNMKIKRTWCTAEDCLCWEYYQHRKSRQLLEAQCRDGGIVCYESQMLREWKAMAGIVQNGLDKGRMMKLKNVGRGSLCVLTTRDPDSKESDRYIFAVFLVDEYFEGDSREEGYVRADPKYRLKLTPRQARSTLFWSYHANESRPEVPAWNSGLHRYFGDDQAAVLLRDIARGKEGQPDHPLALELLERFCAGNGIDPDMLSQPAGALIR